MKLLNVIFLLSFLYSCTNKAQVIMEYNELTPEEENVILRKGTEMPFTGKYLYHKESGIYACKRCGASLFESADKFESHCGWPSFDDAIPGAVKQIPDADGIRMEIVCGQCSAHLGHVFTGEMLTEKNTRFCVNSISLSFSPARNEVKTDTAYFAAGCFWGVEYYFKNMKGVKSTTAGYMGGNKSNPSYQEVCTGTTGHAEVVEVVFDKSMVSFKELAQLFFEIHDFTQVNRQGPDIGEQYRSDIFYNSEEQKNISAELIETLIKKGYDVETGLTSAMEFWPAEDYHQDYYEKTGKEPYCHFRRKIFE